MKIYTLILFLFIFVSTSVNLIGQDDKTSVDNEDQSIFTIIISTHETGFNLECLVGCKWKELTFSNYVKAEGKINYKKAIVDDSGVSSAESSIYTKTDSDKIPASKFAFSIQQTEEGVYLQGIKGTAWERMSYQCVKPNCKQAIDDIGGIILEPSLDRKR